MSRTSVIVLSIAFIALLIFGAYALTRQDSEIPQEPTQPDPFNPGSTGGVTNGAAPEGKLVLTLSDGTTAYVDDFTEEGQPEWAGPDSGYNVAGSGSDSFAITYYPPDADSSAEISVSLLKEPIGEARREAETALRERFGLSDDQFCKLSVGVYTLLSVNEQYAATDLGLSFCPGAVPLP